jgi:hypothetical protein
LQGCPIAGLEQVIENLASLRLWIVNQRTARSSRAHGAKAVKHSTWAIAIQNYTCLLADCDRTAKG